MAVSVFTAAKRICERGEWRVSNLALQKILYLIHMVKVGKENDRPLITSLFEAWDYGPVEPSLYHRVKVFGSNPIQDIFPETHDISGTPEAEYIDDGCKFLLTKRPAELVAMTHWEEGAWAKNYVSGARGIPIPNSDIIDEYRRRVAARRA